MKLLLISFFTFFSGILQAQWTNTSGPSGGVGDIVQLKSLLFANSYAGGIYRSGDNGEHWDRINNGLPAYPYCHAITSIGDIIYASINAHGIYKSTDFGNSWMPTDHSLDGMSFLRLFANESDLYVGHVDDGFYHSSNGGKTWEKRGSNIESITRFAAVGQNLIIAARSAGLSTLYKSTDKGITLTQLSSPVPHINFMAASRNVIFIIGSAGEGVMSNDAGATWTTIDFGSSHTPSSFGGLYARNNRVIIGGGNHRLFVSDDEGITWSAITNLPYSDPTIRIFSEGETIMAGSDPGFYFSNDNGVSWSERNEGLRNLTITHLVASKSILYAGTSIGIFVSADNGSSWEKPENGLAEYSRRVNGIHVSPTSMVIGTSNGVFKSSGNGLKWELKLSLSNPINNSFSALAGHGNKLVAFETFQQNFSTDEGETWTSKNDAIFTGFGVTKAILQGDTIIALAPNEILMTQNFGASWKRVRVTQSYFMPSDAIFVGNKLIVATQGGAFSSDDFGATWAKIQGLPSNDITTIISKNDSIYACTTDGIFLSSELGSTWHEVNNESVNRILGPMAFNDQYLFSGSDSYSVWKHSWKELRAKVVITELEEPPWFENSDLMVFPNPTKAAINFTMADLQFCRVRDYLGREVRTYVNIDQEDTVHSINIANLPPGIYFLELQGTRKQVIRFSKI